MRVYVCMHLGLLVICYQENNVLSQTKWIYLANILEKNVLFVTWTEVKGEIKQLTMSCKSRA